MIVEAFMGLPTGARLYLEEGFTDQFGYTFEAGMCVKVHGYGRYVRRLVDEESVGTPVVVLYRDIHRFKVVKEVEDRGSSQGVIDCVALIMLGLVILGNVTLGVLNVTSGAVLDDLNLFSVMTMNIVALGFGFLAIISRIK